MPDDEDYDIMAAARGTTPDIRDSAQARLDPFNRACREYVDAVRAGLSVGTLSVLSARVLGELRKKAGK